MSKHLALIGGTGLASLKGFTLIKEHSIETPFGKPSANILEGKFFDNENEQGSKFFFLARHGDPHTIPPHKINYRANIWALNHLGVDKIIAINAVGGIHPELDAGSLCVPDQLIDYTFRRENTFFDGESFSQNDKEVSMPVHIDFTNPFSNAIRDKIIKVGQSLNLDIMQKACYACVEGPRLETAAEINCLEKDGCDVVGMTCMPEAALARECSMDYASLCLVVNKAAGRNDGPITMKQIEHTMEIGIKKIILVLKNLVNSV